MWIAHVQQHTHADADTRHQQRDSYAAPTGPGRGRRFLMRRRFRGNVRALHSINRNRGRQVVATG
ncbi:hypothetical protein GCM10023319_58880 [Nocardia iowensis]